MESLCELLAESIRNPNHGIFQKEVIITQGAGIDAWLKTRLAQRNSVFANFEFQNQDGFFAAVYQLASGKRLQNNIDTVKYKIYNCFAGEDFTAAFPEVAGYYEDNELRRFQLAERVSDLFDQYQLYRPEMIEKWTKETFKPEEPIHNSAEKWQWWLWQKLGIESRSEIKQQIFQALHANQELLKETYPVITLFGISIYTQFHLDFFKKLGEYTKVDFYVCLPTSQSDYQNELLVSYGSKAKELADMFEITDFNTQEYTNDTLLGRIQNQILHNSTNCECLSDDSIQITSSYTPVREVETLYNYLLDLFEKDQKENNQKARLKPDDILVITTDINKYAPFIKAVFRNVPVTIPFQVSGAANNTEDSIVSAVELVLNFCEEDLTSEKVVSLLEQKRIKQRFGIQDCNYIRSVVRKANIRFGRENRVEDDTQYVSWKYGLEKILLGYAMLTDKEFDNKYPFRDAEASQSHDLLRLKAFLEKLESVIDAQKEKKTLADWKIFLLEEVIGQMVYLDGFDKKDRTELSSIYNMLSFTNNSEIKEEIPFNLLREELKSKLFTEPKAGRLNSGNVTVSSAIPVRGIPFKVICFLGLNNDVFPGKSSFTGFDLLGEEYLAGDRNKKETDKYLFLDTILAAREKLYLSSIGQSAKDNTGIPQSIVLDTLVDYTGSDKIVVKHPLHGYSPAYHENQGHGLFTYLYGEKPDAFDPKEHDPTETSELSVHSFVKFFEHPTEWYFNNVLGIKYSDKDDSLPETELFTLDHLQKWVVKNDLLRLTEDEAESYLQKGIKEGLLPLKNLGKLSFDELIKETTEIRKCYDTLTKGQKERNIFIDIVVDDTQITGSVDCIFDKTYKAFSFSKSLQKNLVRAYLKTLLLCAQTEIDSSALINTNGQIINLPFYTADEAKLKLKDLLVYLRKGAQSPLKFTLKAIKPPPNTQLSIDTILKSFEDEAAGNKNNVPPVMANWYMKSLNDQRYFEDFSAEDFEEFKIVAKLLNLLTD